MGFQIWVLGALLPTSLFALVVDPKEIDSQLNVAPVIADLRIESVLGFESANRAISSLATARVLQIVKSGGGFIAEGQTILVETMGGETGEYGLFISGFPRFHVGESYRAFLKPNQSRFQVVGFENGFVPKILRRNPSRNRTDGSNGQGSGAFLHWEGNYFPIPYLISARNFAGHSDFVQAIDESFYAWHVVRKSLASFQPLGCSAGDSNLNDGLNHIILVSSNWPFDSAAIAITRNFYIAGNSEKAGMILDSDILLNAVDHEFTTTNEPGKHDIQNIVTHEVGHFLGLGHEIDSEDSDATMYKSAGPNEFKKRELKPNDIAGVQVAYPGVGFKPELPVGPSCPTAEGTFTCAAVHLPDTKIPSSSHWTAAAVAILGIILLGRLFFERFHF